MKEKKTRIFFLLKIQRQFSFEKQSPMEIFIILVLCALFRYVNSVLCYSSTRISYPIVNKSSFESLERLIRENLRGEEQDICDLWITILYPTLDITLTFTKDLDILKIFDGNTILYTNVDIIHGEIKQITSLQHSCSTYDYCDIEFLLTHIQWLINDGYQEDLVNNTSPYLIETKMLDECYYSHGLSFPCSSHEICGFINTDDKLEQGCFEHITSGLLIITKINIRTWRESQLFTFGCNYELCNSYETFVGLKSFVEQYCSITLMRNALLNGQLIKTTTTTNIIHTESSNSINNSTNFSFIPTNSTSVHRFYLLIIILLYLSTVY